MAGFEIIIFLSIVFGLIYFRVPVLVWTLTIGILLTLLTYFASYHIIFLAICWIFFLAAFSFANLKKLRQAYFTTPLVKTLQNKMPPMSATEREAIEAGNVWWEKDLFCGKPRWKKLLAMPQPQLSTEEQSFIDNQVETLCAMLNDWHIVHHEKDLPQNVWDYLKQERFFGLVIPKEYGGLGFSALAHSNIIVKIATRSISAAVTIMVPNSLGPGELLLHYGTDAQKTYYLPRLARGEEIPCFALTGPEAGSDAGSITDSGIVCYGEHEGKKTLGIRLCWDKRYITLAPVATVLGIAFRLYDPDNLLGKDKEDIGITLCLVPTAHAGVMIGDRHLPLNLAFMNGPTSGKNVFVPIDWIIGGVTKAGAGWKMLMECLSIGRSISLPALSTACGKLIYRMTGAYARLRRQFNTSISNFEGIEEALSHIAGLTYIIESCRIMTAGAVDQKIKPAIVSAIAKYHMTEMSRTIVSHAMDIHAGHGIQMGPRNVLASAHMSIPVSITVEGANILTRNLIIFGQGAIRCHPYVLQEMELFSLPDNQMKIQKLDRVLLSHIGYLMSNIVRTLWCGLTAARFVLTPTKGVIVRYYQQLTRMSCALALLSDVSMMLLGGALKRKERTSARLGDILSQLYLGSSVLKYFNDHGKPVSDLDYVKWSIETCLYRAQIAVDDLLNNFPNKWIGKILHWIIFPLGMTFAKPSDNLCKSITKKMLTPSEFRERIVRYSYVGDNQEDAVKRMEMALSQIITNESLWKKVQSAIQNNTQLRRASWQEQISASIQSKHITENEADILRQFHDLQQEIIKVNQFSFDLNSIVS